MRSSLADKTWQPRTEKGEQISSLVHLTFRLGICNLTLLLLDEPPSDALDDFLALSHKTAGAVGLFHSLQVVHKEMNNETHE